jgi:Transposase DDE domain
MRRTHYTLTPRNVTHLTLQALLDTLAWTSARVDARLLVQLLIRAAAQMRSLAAVVAAATVTFSFETLRQALRDLLPSDPLDFLPTATRLLQQRIPRSLRKRPQTMAIDLHLRPFYGKKTTPGIYRGQRKDGTRTFFAYATVMVIRPGQSFTIGVTPVVNGEEQTALLARLMGQAEEAGLTVQCLLLDRGFYAATTLHWLQQRSIPFILPMIRRGRKARRIADCTGTERFFVKGRRGWDTYTWTAKRSRHGTPPTVTIDVCMAPVASKKREGHRLLVYACSGVGKQSPTTIVERYRRRFGIETSYRQLGEGLAMTCSTHATYRLLVVMIALVLRNMWLWLHWRVLSERAVSPRGRRQLRLSKLRLRTLMAWLVCELDDQLKTRVKVVSERYQLTNVQRT